MFIYFYSNIWNKKSKLTGSNYGVHYIKLGRKPGPAKSKLDPHKELIQEYLDKEISKASISKLLGVHIQTLYSYIKKYKMKKSDLS